MSSDNNVNCTICLNDIPDQPLTTPCGHTFCKEVSNKQTHTPQAQAHTVKRTHIHAHKHTHIHTHSTLICLNDIHTISHRTHTRTHAHTHTRMPVRTHSQTHAHIHSTPICVNDILDQPPTTRSFFSFILLFVSYLFSSFFLTFLSGMLFPSVYTSGWRSITPARCVASICSRYISFLHDMCACMYDVWLMESVQPVDRETPLCRFEDIIYIPLIFLHDLRITRRVADSFRRACHSCQRICL